MEADRAELEKVRASDSDHPHVSEPNASPVSQEIPVFPGPWISLLHDLDPRPIPLNPDSTFDVVGGGARERSEFARGGADAAGAAARRRARGVRGISGVCVQPGGIRD